MTIGQSNDMYKQLQEVMEKCDKLFSTIDNLKKEHKKEIKKLKKSYQTKIDILNAKVVSLEKENAELKLENKKLKNEVARLKVQLKKNSSNSNKPSSTNGFKRVITNRREKSDRSKGGQFGHEGHSLGKKQLEQVLASDNVIVNPPVEVNKTEDNKNMKPFKSTQIDIAVRVSVTDFLYYPDKDGTFNIPEKHRKHISYGSNLKALATTLMYESYNSTDATQNILLSITNNTLKIPKSTLVNWSTTIADKLSPEIDNIEEQLLNSHYAHFDESQITVDSKAYNEVCACNDTHVRMWTMKSKKHEELEKIDFFKSFMGIIVKDGTDLYNGFGSGFSQCISHIQRYLKGVYENVDHKAPRKMSEFFTKYNNYRNELINKEQNSFSDDEYNRIIQEYEGIIKEWKKEWMNSKDNNSVYDDERKLLARMEDDDKEQILYFLKDFKVPSTNNPAESAQRNIKIKQKIGKFRSEKGAEIYAIIRSCINTYKKNGINVYNALISAFEGNVVIA